MSDPVYFINVKFIDLWCWYVKIIDM